MKKSLTPTAYSVLIAGVLATAVWVSAGDLNPPPGPIAPTQRTPIGVNTTPGDATALFRITQPGSYYLTGNITGVVGRHGIAIATSGVSLDLMGFQMEGVAGSLDGIHVSDLSFGSTAVVNGSIRNWNRGTFLQGGEARVADLRVYENVSDGLYTGNHSVVTGCIASVNGGRGIHVSGTGIISNCDATFNTSHGISVSSNSIISNSTARLNEGAGFFTGLGCTVTNCAALNNEIAGFSLGDGNTVTHCSASLNTGDGFLVTNDSNVRGNMCNGNGNGAGDGAGIHVTGSDNLLDGNNCTSNDRGIDVDAAGNFITRNTCSGNPTNYDVVAANNILVVLVVDAPAVLGNSGGASPGSTDPNANYAY
jgi:parallel beta-helix repeat protein